VHARHCLAVLQHDRKGGGLAHDAPLSLRYPGRYQPTEEHENHADRARQAI
jgi:hypothetical protein